jgi:hypothetical protein
LDKVDTVSDLPPNIPLPTVEEKQAAKDYAERMLAMHNSAARQTPEMDRMAHALVRESNARQELAAALVEQGRLDDATRVLNDAGGVIDDGNRQALYEEIASQAAAIHKPDTEFCDCVGHEILPGNPAPACHVRQQVYSIPHGGWMNDVICGQCGARNITPNLPPDIIAFQQAAAIRSDGDTDYNVAVAATNQLKEQNGAS